MRLNSKVKFLSCFCVCGFLAGLIVYSAAESEVIPYQLSLEEAVLRGLQNNRGPRVAQLTPIIEGIYEEIEQGVF